MRLNDYQNKTPQQVESTETIVFFGMIGFIICGLFYFLPLKWSLIIIWLILVVLFFIFWLGCKFDDDYIEHEHE